LTTGFGAGRKKGTGGFDRRRYGLIIWRWAASQVHKKLLIARTSGIVAGVTHPMKRQLGITCFSLTADSDGFGGNFMGTSSSSAF
jgi:hypothetical protein